MASPATGLPFFDNFGDNYTVLASAGGYSQAGFTPVKVSPLAPEAVGLMLIPKNSIPYTRLLAADADDDAAAQDRYTQLMETQSAVLACFFNPVAAMSQIHLPVGTPLYYIQQLIWDNSGGQEPKQDRFFAWADARIVDQVALAAFQGQFAPEVGTALLNSARPMWIPNEATGTLTDPRVVYVLRWIAGRHAGVADFDPPYILQ